MPKYKFTYNQVTAEEATFVIEAPDEDAAIEAVSELDDIASLVKWRCADYAPPERERDPEKVPAKTPVTRRVQAEVSKVLKGWGLK
jgi:hypothetical protein